MCGQKFSGVDAACILVAIVLEYTLLLWSVFRRVAFAIGGVTRGACFARYWIGEGADVVKHIAQSVAVINIRS